MALRASSPGHARGTASELEPITRVCEEKCRAAPIWAWASGRGRRFVEELAQGEGGAASGLLGGRGDRGGPSSGRQPRGGGQACRFPRAL